MFLDKFLSKIGDIFKGLFNSAQKTWDKLSPEIQNALLHGSGVIGIINKGLDEAPEVVIETIKKRFPDFPLDKLETGLKDISKGIGIATDINNPDLKTTIENLQKFLSGLEGKKWAWASDTLARGLSIFFAPETTKFAIVSSLIEFVYQRFIKKQE